jgi:hypothetical protein
VVAERWRELHNKELYYLYCSSVRIRWAGYVAYIGNMKNAYNILVRELGSKRLLVDLHIEGMIIFTLILKAMGGCELNLCVAGYCSMACSCQHSSECLGSLKGGKFVVQCRNC